MKFLWAILLGFAFVSSPFVVTLPAALPQKTASPVRRAVIDINRASVDDLTCLPGIGPKLAQQIVAYRTKQGPFHRVEDLMIIKGIGSKKWNALRPYVCVGCTAMRK